MKKWKDLRQENRKEVAALQRIGYIYFKYINQKRQTKIHFSELAQQAKNPAPEEGAESIYLDRDEIEYMRYEKHRILLMQIIYVSCKVLKFGYDNLGLVTSESKCATT